MHEKLVNLLSKTKGKYVFDENLAKHTWLGVGGPAEVLFSPKDTDDLCFFLKNCPEDIPLFVIGGGSNLLVRDGGIKGVVIKLNSPYFKTMQYEKDKLTCFSGVNNATLYQTLIDNQIGGLEFLCSIPGTVGGAVKTNAGCFGKCLSDVLVSAKVADRQGNIFEVDNTDFHFAYRHSDFPKDWIILALTFQTEKKTVAEIEEVLRKHKEYRKAHQPYNARTAGSTFKNPKDHAAWMLIKEAGCDHLCVGDAAVSDIHCNFFINKGQALASDFENLGDEIVRQVKEKTGIILEWEVQKIGQKT